MQQTGTDTKGPSYVPYSRESSIFFFEYPGPHVMQPKVETEVQVLYQFFGDSCLSYMMCSCHVASLPLNESVLPSMMSILVEVAAPHF
jgi:hypothetical protein